MRPLHLLLIVVVAMLYSSSAAADLFVVHGLGADTISRLDSSTGMVLGSFPTPVQTPSFPADGLAFSGDSLFYTTFFGDTIFTLDPFSGAVTDSFASPGSIDALAYGTTVLGPTLFALDPDIPTIYLMDPDTGTVLSSFTVPFLLLGGMDFNPATGTLLVTDSSALQAPRAYELDPVTGSLLGSFSLNFTSFGLGFDEEHLFVSQISGPFAGSVLEISPDTGSILKTFAAPTSFPTALAGGRLASPVPEPGTLWLVVLFAGAACQWSRRSRR